MYDQLKRMSFAAQSVLRRHLRNCCQHNYHHLVHHCSLNHHHHHLNYHHHRHPLYDDLIVSVSFREVHHHHPLQHYHCHQSSNHHHHNNQAKAGLRPARPRLDRQARTQTHRKQCHYFLSITYHLKGSEDPTDLLKGSDHFSLHTFHHSRGDPTDLLKGSDHFSLHTLFVTHGGIQPTC